MADPTEATTAEPTRAIDPALSFLGELAAQRPERPTDLDERRRDAANTMLLIPRPDHTGVEVVDHAVPVDGGEITVRVYRPTEPTTPGPQPVFFFVHGGGWYQGNLDTAEIECGPVDTRVGCVVVSVDYRLAPEHRFPVPLQDCVAAYEWMLERADELGIDTSRIAVGGTSAGGNLVAATCLVVRDRGLTAPLLQLLDAPCTDLTLSARSIELNGRDFGLTKADVEECADFYTTPEQRTDPLASPALAEDLSGLPPAVVITAELDPLVDDGERFVTLLRAAGVPAACVRVTGQFHGSWIIPVSMSSRLVEDIRMHTLQRAFDGTLRPEFPS